MNKGNRNPQCSGITLLELLAVMVVIVIIGAISIPAFISIGRGRGMQYAVSTMFTHLSLARQRAITHRRKVEFHFTNHNEYSAFQVKERENNGTEVVISRLVTNPPGVTFSPGSHSSPVIFTTDGGHEGEMTHNIMITYGTASKAITNTISINKLTGGITVH